MRFSEAERKYRELETQRLSGELTVSCQNRRPLRIQYHWVPYWISRRMYRRAAQFYRNSCGFRFWAQCLGLEIGIIVGNYE